jgi:transaldolase
MVNINKFKIKLFADGADLEDIKKLNKNSLIKGFTTNPTLMRKAGIEDYEKFSKQVINLVKPKSISLEVFADDLPSMKEQAEKISRWGKNVYVKIPIQNTKGKITTSLINELNKKNISLNITAVFTISQVRAVLKNIDKKTSVIISIFAGRIADTGLDPEEIIKESIKISKKFPNVEILWASPREVLNIVQAEKLGTHILTATPDILSKIKNFNKDLNSFSLETVKMFYEDAVKSKYKI